MMFTKHYPMKSDVREKKDAYLLEVDLPGCNKEDVKVSIENGYLDIEAAINKEKEINKKNLIQRERFSGDYKRSFYIGEPVDDTKIKASYRHGVLRLLIPKESKEEIEQKKIIAIE